MSEEELVEYCKVTSLEINNMQHTIDKLQQEKQQLQELMVNLYKEFKLGNVSTATEHKMICFQDEIHKKEVDKLKQQRDSYKSVIGEIRKEINNNMHTYEDDGDCGVDCCCDGFELLKILDKANIKESD